MLAPLQQQLVERIEASLHELLLPETSDIPGPLRQAMEYAVFPGGKRLRALLVVLGCRAFGGREEDALPAAVALELIHCYSLVHDDLPAMDDDDLRRGRPTCHKAHGEAMAILAGDALLTRALEVVARYSPARVAAVLTAEIAAAAGVAGMVGGQAADLLGEGRDLSEEDVRWIHLHKTGALIQVAVCAGARVAGADAAGLEAADGFGRNLGLCFQVVDDLLGRSGSEEVTGKPVGKDDERGKATYPAVVGEAAARQRACELTAEASRYARRFARPEELMALAQRLKERVT